MPEHPAQIKQQSVVSYTLMAFSGSGGSTFCPWKYCCLIHWTTLTVRSFELCSVQERTQQKDQTVVRWSSHLSRVTKETHMVLEASTVGEDSV